MKPDDIFKEYTQLVKQMMTTQARVSKTLDHVLTELDKERTKYDRFNSSSFLAKHRTLIIALTTPVLVLTTLALIAWTFVGTGHPINIKAPGGYQITSKP